jgi:hypothetical protein
LVVDLAFETKASAVSLRHANPEQVDGASALAKSLQDVALVPEVTMRSVLDVTSSPLDDQKVPTDSHPTSFVLSLNPPSNLAFIGRPCRGEYKPSGVSLAVALGPADGRLDLRALWVRGR